MYCSKCGNELKNNETYCPNCGTKAGTAGNPINLNISADEIKNKATKIKSNFTSGVADLGKNKILLFATVALLVISIIFAITDTFKVDAILGINESMSMFDDMNGLRNFFIIGYVLAIVCLLIPLLFKKAWKPVFFLPAKIITLSSATWFIIYLITGLTEVSSSEYSSMAEFSPTTAGWIFIISTVGAIFLSFKVALDFKKLPDTAKEVQVIE